MTKRELPSPEFLRKILRYEPETGKLFWLPREIESFPKRRFGMTWNRRFANAEAFTNISAHGYKQGKIGDYNFKAHRIIWVMQTDSWPAKQIDHINGDRSDNRWVNLREATASQNSCNRFSAANSSSKYLGVSYYEPTGKWKALIKSKGKTKFLGYFFSEIEAALAYDAASRIYHGEFANPNFPSNHTDPA